MAGGTERRGARRAGVRWCLALLGLGAPQVLPAQAATAVGPDSMAMRRTAIMSVLASRERREGSAIEVEMCSVLQAMGHGASLRRSAPPALTSSFSEGNGSGCVRRGGGRGADPWVPIGEVSSIAIERQRRGPERIAPVVTIATVVLTIWPSPRHWEHERYEFVARSDTVWAQVSFKRSPGGHVDGGPRTTGPLVILNGAIIGTWSDSSVLSRMRGAVVDSISFIAPDSGMKVFGSAAWQGVLIIGARRPGSRPPG